MFFRLTTFANVVADSLANAQSVFSNPVKHALGAYFTIQIVNLFGGIGISTGAPLFTELEPTIERIRNIQENNEVKNLVILQYII